MVPLANSEKNRKKIEKIKFAKSENSDKNSRDFFKKIFENFFLTEFPTDRQTNYFRCEYENPANCINTILHYTKTQKSINDDCDKTMKQQRENWKAK